MVIMEAGQVRRTMKVAQIAVAVCALQLAACAYVPMSQQRALPVSSDYIASGDVPDTRAFIYGKRTLIEFKTAPALLVIKDADGAELQYEKAGHFYRLDRIVDRFSAWADGRAMSYEQFRSPNAIDSTTTTASPATHTPFVSTSSAQWQFGMEPGWASITVKDSDGGTKTKMVPDLLQFAVNQKIARDAKMHYALFAQSFDVEAGQRGVAEHLQRFGAATDYRQYLNTVNNWRPWAGAGLGISQDQLTQRYLVDNDGYVDHVLADKTKINFGMRLSAGVEWLLLNDWTAGAQLRFESPLGNGVRAVAVSFSLMY